MVKHVKNFENVYVSYDFFDGTKTSTNSIPHDTNLRWDAKHVHLIGGLDQKKFRDNLST